jgi:hypothetical protein
VIEAFAGGEKRLRALVTAASGDLSEAFASGGLQWRSVTGAAGAVHWKISLSEFSVTGICDGLLHPTYCNFAHCRLQYKYLI